MKIAEALANVGVLAIDTSPFIYYIERYPEYVEKARALSACSAVPDSNQDINNYIDRSIE